jgi:glycyl-tRNA synthetase beta chain
VEERLEGLVDAPVEVVRAARRSPVSDLGTVGGLAAFLAALGAAALEPAHTAYTRAVRIAGRAEPGEVNPGLLVEPAERDLAEAVEAAEPRIREAAEERRFDDGLAAASALAPVVDRFFEDVLVMADDAAVRENRLRLLLRVRDAIGLLGDLAQIPL